MLLVSEIETEGAISTSLFKGSPYRRRHDLEAESSRSPYSDAQDHGMSSSPFYITRTKDASIERLRRWRQAALVLNASRRFRYTLDLKKEEEKRQLISKIKAHAQAVRAAYLFTQAGIQGNGTQPLPPTPRGDFAIGPEQLASMTRDHNFVAFQQYGGMTVVEAYVGDKKIDPPGSSSQLSKTQTSLLVEGIAQNSNGSVFTPEGGGDVEVSGSPTEKAILNWGIELGMEFDAVRKESSIIHVFPFNSEKKRGSVAIRLPDSKVRIHWKGAAEIVLAVCTQYLDANDNLVAMDENKGAFFRNAIEDMAARSLRCVAIAYRFYESEKVPSDEEELTRWALPEDDLVLLAIVGIKVYIPLL